MKLFTILHKNFRLLFRSRSSAFVVFVGPLLIISLILLTFSFPADYAISVGIVNQDTGEVANNFIGQLDPAEYTALTYTDIDLCINDVKLGVINLCLNFPADFSAEGGDAKTVKFYIDQSRINIAESLIHAISTNIGTTSQEITLSKTEGILLSIGEGATTILEEQDTASLQVAETVNPNVLTVETQASSISASDAAEELSSVSDFTTTNENVDAISLASVDLEVKTAELLTAVSKELDTSPDLQDEYDALDAIFETSNSNLTDSLTSLETTLASLETEIASASDELVGIQDSSAQIETKIADVRVSIGVVEEALLNINEQATTILALSGEDVENHFEVEVNEVLSNDNRSLFIFPYYLMLLVLFVGMMLSSNLVVMEKESLAYFRNLTSPTSELTHLLARFLCNFSIISLQLTAVLLSVFYFVKIPILANYYVSIVILLLSVSFFILLGYLIGHLFKTQEGITIAFISVGGIFAFLSNLILPIESFPQFVRSALLFNPYVLASESLKKAMLFHANYASLGLEIGILLAYTVVALILVIILQRISFLRFSLDLTKRNLLKRPHITTDKHFRLENTNLVKDLPTLRKALSVMSNEEYNQYILGRNNEFAIWVKDVFRDKRLYRAMQQAKDKRSLIEVLDIYLAGQKVRVRWFSWIFLRR